VKSRVERRKLKFKKKYSRYYTIELLHTEFSQSVRVMHMEGRRVTHRVLLKKTSVLIIKAVLSYRMSIGNFLILCFFFGDWGPCHKI